jgi:hypothetical protein
LTEVVHDIPHFSGIFQQYTFDEIMTAFISSMITLPFNTTHSEQLKASQNKPQTNVSLSLT